MNAKKIIGILMVIGGVALMLFSNYINTQVAAGNVKIASAEKKVSQGQGLFSLTPVTKEIGKGMTSGAEKKISKGKEDIAYYTQLAKNCQLGGIALIVLGAGLFLFSFKKKSKK